MYSILVVEDHAEAREPLTRLLRYEGYETRSAANGAEALALMSQFRPDLVLMDLMMPKMTGLALLEAIRADGRMRDVPVVVMTGLMQDSQLARARELGARQIISKASFTIPELLTTIQHYIPAKPVAATS